MRKFATKIVAVSAVCACAFSMFSTIHTSAASEQFNTYRVYYDVSKSGVREFNIELKYKTNIKVRSSEVTSICPKGTFTSVGNQNAGIYLTYYKSDEGTIAETGTVATEDMLVPLSSEINNNIYEYISFEGCYAKDYYGKIMDSVLTMPVILVGDANGDGIVDMSDAVIITQHINNPTRYPMSDENRQRAADVDGDGVITTNDADMIRRFRLELISHF